MLRQFRKIAAVLKYQEQLMNTNLHPQISEEERLTRKRAVDVARGSVRFEGFVLAPEIELINDRYINGELTSQEHVEAVLAATSN